MTGTVPSPPSRQVIWWAISAGIFTVGYARIVGLVFVLRGVVGLLVPSIYDPHPTLAGQVSVSVAWKTSLIGP